ncbi:unnamed protein product [Candidula unifasciata]|uniref:TM2 domain-containing protein n=1 Tax=Candidula unifasciata TaxID=100452 RepID=A0A8S3ZVH5_9EUPU|nr:unnamed protein product [Candidula unifasciata]
MVLVQRIKYLFLRLYSLGIAVSALLALAQVIIEVQAGDGTTEDSPKKCTELLLGQYLCSDPEIDPKTQQARYCSKEKQEVAVLCKLAPGIGECEGLFPNGTFQRTVPCKWTNGHSFETALLLSVFLGMFGVDRFYLGYPAIGLLKFATLGFMFLGQLVDILLIATQVLTPSDGSAYVVDYYGAASERIIKDNETYLVPGY